MAGLLQRTIDLAKGNWRLGAAVDARYPNIPTDRRSQIISSIRRGDRFGKALSRARSYSYASDFAGRTSGRGALFNQGPRANITIDLALVRGQARRVARENETAAHAISILRDWTVRTGPNIKPKAVRKATASKLAPTWKAWFETSACDVTRHSNFYELSRLIIQSMLEAGEVLVRLRPRSMRDGLPVPLAIEVLECEYLYDGPAPAGVMARNSFAAGIEFSPIGHPEAYWLYRSHPQDPGSLDRTPVRVPVIDPVTGMRQISHLFIKERPGQIRGIPMAARALESVYKSNDWVMAMLDRKRREARILSFVKADKDADAGAPPPVMGVPTEETYSLDTADGGNPDLPTSSGPDPLELMEFVSEQIMLGHSVIPLPAGTSVQDSTFANATDFAPFVQYMNRLIAAAFNVPYEILTGDLTGVTYSSAKVGLLQFKAWIEALQEYLTSQLCQFVWDGFVMAGNRAGLWPDTVIPCVFRFDRFPSVEPQKDLGVLILKLKNGLISPRRACAELGEDLDEILDEIAEDKTRLEELGIDLFGAMRLAVSKAKPPSAPA